MSEDITHPGERRVVVAGDWEGNVVWATRCIELIGAELPDVTTVLHLGDFRIGTDKLSTQYVRALEAACAAAGIERILVTPGNHDNWAYLDGLFAARPGQPVPVSDRIWVLPRGYRFTLGGQRFLSFGGAASVNAEMLIEGRSWWPGELSTEEQVAEAIAGGPADVMLTHEAIDGGTQAVDARVADSGHLTPRARADSDLSRARTTRVWAAVRPSVLFHGHMHLRDADTHANGQRVYALNCHFSPGNMGVLDLADLTWSDLV